MKYLKLTVTLVSLLSSVIGEAAWARDNNRAYSSRNDHSYNYLRNDHARNYLRGDHGYHRHYPNGHQRHHSHSHSYFRVIIAPAWPYYHYHHLHYGAPVVVAPAPSSPPVYIEQGGGQDTAYWYHCNNPEGYYPYIKECPGGWQKVVPHAPPS